MSVVARLALFDSQSRRFSICESEPIVLLDGEVLVKVTCCTICGSDVHTYCGRRHGHANTVLGHEIIGTVEAWHGDGPPKNYFGQPIDCGQRITWCLSVGCNQCLYCCSGLPQKCVQLFKYGHSQFVGKPTGGLAEYCVLTPRTAIFPVSGKLSDKVACPANCATATVMAAIRIATEIKQIENHRVLIMGLGMLGLTACAVCHSKGCVEITACDPNPERQTMAGHFGANTICHPDEMKGEFDIVFEFSGAQSANCASVSRLAIGGVAVLGGAVFPGEPMSVDAENLIRKMLTVRGLHNYRPDDLATALEFLEENHERFPFDVLVSPPFSLEEAAAAFETAQSGKFIRVAVNPQLKP